MTRRSFVVAAAAALVLAVGLAAFGAPVLDTGHGIAVAILAFPANMHAMRFGPRIYFEKPNDQGTQITLADIEKVGDEIKRIAEKVNKELADANAKVKEVGEELVTKTKAGEKVSTELKESVDKALLKQGELQQGIEELKGTVTELSQEVAKRKSRGDRPEAEQTPGELFIADEGFKKAQTESQRFRGRVRVLMKSITTSGSGFSVDQQRIPGIVQLAERRMTVRDLLTPGRTGSNAIQYIRETGFTNNAAVQTEGETKGESDIDYELITRSVATIAHFIVASKQILDDAPMLQSSIDGRLRYGLAYKEEDQLLNGSGTGANLHGIIPQASDYAPAFQPASLQRIDTLRLALLQSELAEFPATGLVLHPTDWAKVELTKDGEARYIFAQPQTQTQPMLWGRPVVATQAMDLGEFLAGAFRLGAQIFDREDANVEISTEDNDNFRKNLVTIRAEERLVLAVYRPEAFTHGEFGDAS